MKRAWPAWVAWGAGRARFARARLLMFEVFARKNKKEKMLGTKIVCNFPTQQNIPLSRFTQTYSLPQVYIKYFLTFWLSLMSPKVYAPETLLSVVSLS